MKIITNSVVVVIYNSSALAFMIGDWPSTDSEIYGQYLSLIISPVIYPKCDERFLEVMVTLSV